MPRMTVIAGVRQAEPWSFLNIVGGVLLLIAFAALLFWLVRRYLDS